MKIFYFKNKLPVFIMTLALVYLTGCEECGLNGFETDSLPNGQIGFPYDSRIVVDNECRPLDERFWIIGGFLPEGISMSHRGELRGIPTKTGNYRFSVEVAACFAEDLWGYYDCEGLIQSYQIIVE